MDQFFKSPTPKQLTPIKRHLTPNKNSAPRPAHFESFRKRLSMNCDLPQRKKRTKK